jgi:hypothetical protein
MYWLYADQYARNKSLVKTSVDGISWGTTQYVNNPASLRTKHFDTIVLSENQKQDIVNFVFKNQVNQITDFTKRTLYPHYQNVVYLKNYVSGSKFTPDVTLSGKTLYLVDQAITIDTISIPVHNGYFIPKNRYHLSELHLCVFNNSSLTINYNNANNTGDNNYILTPSLQSLVLTGNNGNTENILILKKAVETDSFYRVLNSGNFAYAFNQLYNTNQSAYNQIDLNTLAVGGVISNLVLADNTVYYYSGASTITINAVDVSALNRIRSTVWFSIMNNTTGPSLTLKSSATIITPGDVDFVISKANGNNERLIPWTRYASSTLRPKF